MSDAVVISIISGAFTSITLIIVAFIKHDQSKLHKQINSRMDELLAINRREGKAEGVQEQKDKK